jgi:hypothetical protein
MVFFMDDFKKRRVPVTEDDQKKSYYKYYGMDMARPSREQMSKALQGPIDPDRALPFSERNRMFDPGYMEEEVGYCVMPDGTGYVANLTPMPGVTAEMFDWWFAWHPLDNLRYKIWDPEDHYRAETMQAMKYRDQELTFRERYWDTTHYVVEDLGAGPQPVYLNFKYPGSMRFDMQKIGTEACETLVCAQSYGEGFPPFAGPDSSMCHMIRKIDGGVELRTRFWFGWVTEDGKDRKTLPDGFRMPPMGLAAMLLHNIKEFTNLAVILPQVYEKEKDIF